MERLSQMPKGDAVEIVNSVIELCTTQLAAATATQHLERNHDKGMGYILIHWRIYKIFQAYTLNIPQPWQTISLPLIHQQFLKNFEYIEWADGLEVQHVWSAVERA